ncbi:hypothetical protein GGX14DRAFT_406904 [Mycena pura]|uniref:Uncharacterized protein n=1 Tax=Mycena pura TaxID=153505 RepID=A0AAD6Y2U1_9AGAR|nr:hypothetical protein GGX14DRAFT_406904 [Mycena pura]
MINLQFISRLTDIRTLAALPTTSRRAAFPMTMSERAAAATARPDIPHQWRAHHVTLPLAERAAQCGIVFFVKFFTDVQRAAASSMTVRARAAAPPDVPHQNTDTCQMSHHVTSRRRGGWCPQDLFNEMTAQIALYAHTRPPSAVAQPVERRQPFDPSDGLLMPPRLEEIHAVSGHWHTTLPPAGYSDGGLLHSSAGGGWYGETQPAPVDWHAALPLVAYNGSMGGGETAAAKGGVGRTWGENMPPSGDYAGDARRY